MPLNDATPKVMLIKGSDKIKAIPFGMVAPYRFAFSMQYRKRPEDMAAGGMGVTEVLRVMLNNKAFDLVTDREEWLIGKVAEYLVQLKEDYEARQMEQITDVERIMWLIDNPLTALDRSLVKNIDDVRAMINLKIRSKT